MMNQHMAAGQQGQQSMPMHHPHHHQHHQSRRHQEYHAYAHQAFPHPQAQPFSPSTQQPMHHNPYAQYHPQHPAYYAQPQSPYIPPRYPHPQQQWMQPHHGHYGQAPSHFMPPQPQQMQFQPRSPMVVSSQPMGQPMTPTSRPMPMHAPTLPATVTQPAQSPMSVPPHVQQQTPSAASPSPVPRSLQPHQEPSPAPSPGPLKQAASPPPEVPRPQSAMTTPLSLPPEHRTPFYPQLPWYSISDASSFPPREMSRRKRRQTLRKPNETLALPSRDQQLHLDEPPLEPQSLTAEEPGSDTSTIAARSEVEAAETPATSQAPSEVEFSQQSTPTTPAHNVDTTKPTSTPTHTRRDTRTSIAVPNIPGLRPKVASPGGQEQSNAHAVRPVDQVVGHTNKQDTEAPSSMTEDGSAASVQTSDQAEAPAAKPKSWADLVRKNAPKTAQPILTNGVDVTDGVAIPQTASLAESLRQYNVDSDTNVSFIEPRGLVNTGNMCYMNSILQVLVFCAPFYTFLDQVRQRTSHSINSETPLVDAMIMFMQEFQTLESRPTAQQLRNSLSQQVLEQFGEPLIPEYVYDVTRKLPTFAHMRRGHQQDAEEFLGFLLEALHEECVKVMQGAPTTASQNDAPNPSNPDSPHGTGDGWLEVGPKQKASTTRTSGAGESSPITKIFGGNLRSELRVPGIKDSVTLEPYKPLQLDIGAPHVNNIVDALKGITRTETLTGDFGGRGNQAKKQVFIDTLPPVLILHLKRFEYVNNLTGTQKIWKKVGYPLELELPKEVFPPAKRSNATLQAGGVPKYRLISVVYHHGKSAAGGHYTVDVLRQDSREWLRMDDTVLRRVRAEDVAAAGAEEDPKVLAKALEAHKAQASSKRNLFDGLDDDNDSQADDTPWSEVNGHNMKDKKGSTSAWAGATATGATGTGTSTPKTEAGKRTPRANASNVKDNKVAYILLYERIRE
ncbi:UCH-domain-containing protein [Polychaeton citri CBS 116435]|uniref:Ubiquitin carboxyl-terminal hydrolase n=1 Tax=Polychaeton citri CBS 116435 TaxID=1314669 RepID=A0A9P4QH30_9PEZI|nr:UCH-domain-containing protein [Polychaeton citri CBS 116435]